MHFIHCVTVNLKKHIIHCVTVNLSKLWRIRSCGWDVEVATVKSISKVQKYKATAKSISKAQKHKAQSISKVQ